MNRLDSFLLLPDPSRWSEAIDQFAKDLAPLVPGSTHEDRAGAIDFLLWSISGGKAGPGDVLPRPFPNAECFAQLFRSVGGDLPAEAEFALNANPGVSPGGRKAVEAYLRDVLAAWSHMKGPPVSSNVWRKVSSDNIVSIAIAAGVRPEVARRFRAAVESIVYIWGRSIRFAYFSLPLIALSLPFGTDDLIGVLERHPRFAPAIRALERITRIGRFLSPARPWRSTPSQPRPPLREGGSDDSFVVPNNPVVVAVLESIWHGGPRSRDLVSGWAEEASLPVFRWRGPRGESVRVYPDPDHLKGALPRGGSAWTFVESLNPLTADVALCLLSEISLPKEGIPPGNPLTHPAVVTPESLLHYRKPGGPWDPHLRERVREELERLTALRIDVERFPVWDGERPRRSRIGWSGDRLFEAVELEQPGARAAPGRTPWLVRAGRWAEWWPDVEGSRHVARLPRSLIGLDHRLTRGHAVMAKKVGERIALLHRAARAERPIEIEIGRLLAMVGELPRPERREKQWAGRVRERFDEALLMLEHQRVFASVSWPDGFGPGDPDRYRGWVPRWLASRVVIQPGSAKAAEPPKGPVTRLGLKGGAIVHHLDMLRAVRCDHGWTQAKLAEHLGVSASFLSKVENGLTTPNPALEQKLIDWLRQLSAPAD